MTAPASVPPRPTLDRELRRHDVALLRDPALQAEVRRQGYAVLDPVLTPAEIGQLLQLADEFLARVEGPTGDEFLTVGRIEDLDLRAEMIDRARAVVLPALEGLFVPGTQFLASAFQVKPASPGSSLNPHQDSSLVDETTWPGIYAWIPLVDTDEENGGLQVVPGSHRFGNLHRTLSVPWQFAGLEDVLRRHSVPLTVAAGGVVLFDSATVHGSPPNRSGATRVALNNFGRPAGAPLMHVYLDDDTTPGMVEAFEITPDFLYREDIMVRPGPGHRAVGERPHVRLTCDADDLDRLCAQAAAELAADERVDS